MADLFTKKKRNVQKRTLDFFIRLIILIRGILQEYLEKNLLKYRLCTIILNFNRLNRLIKV